MKNHEISNTRGPKYYERKLTPTENYYYKTIKSQEPHYPHDLPAHVSQNSQPLTIEEDRDFNQKNKFQLIKSPTAFESSRTTTIKHQLTRSEDKRRPPLRTYSLEDQKATYNKNLNSNTTSHQKEAESNWHYSQNPVARLESSSSENQYFYEKQRVDAGFSGPEVRVELILAENEQLKANLNEQTKIIENAKHDLDKLMDTISLIEEENKKLANEKECLLEYMEGLSRQLERSQKEARDKAYEGLLTTGSNSNLPSFGETETRTNTHGQEMKIQQLNADLKELSDLSSFLQQQLKLLANENAKITGEAAYFQKQCDAVLKEKTELERIRQLQHEELLRIREENNNLMQAHSEMSRRLKSMSEYDTQKTSFIEKDSSPEPYTEFLDKQKDTDSFATGKQDKDEQIRSLLREIDQMRRTLQNNKLKLEQERNAKSGEIRSLYEQHSELRSQMNKLQEENLELFTQCNSLKERLADDDNKFQAINQQMLNKEREIRDLQVKLERNNQKIHELQHTLYERDCTVNELKNEITEIQAKMQEVEGDCESAHQNRENLLFEQKKQRELISKLKEQLAEKDQIILNETQEKDNAHKQFENTKKDLIELTKILEAGLTEEERRRYAMPQLILNGSDVFVFVHERIRAVLLEKEKNKTRLEEITVLKDKITDEKSTLEIENEKLYKSQLVLQEEKNSLNKEVVTLQNKCKELELESEKLHEKAEKEKSDLLERSETMLDQSQARVKELEETCSRLEAQKQELLFTIEKLKESTVNKSIVNIIDEIKDCHFEIMRLQSERASLKNNTEFQDSVMFSFSGSKMSPKFSEPTGIRRKIEELKNAISTTDLDIQSKTARKQSLELELSEAIAREKVKSSQYNNLEKLTNQLRTEINILTRENELIEKAKFDLENSYHDLLRESSRKPYKSSPLKDRSNLSSFIQSQNTDQNDKKTLH